MWLVYVEALAAELGPVLQLGGIDAVGLGIRVSTRVEFASTSICLDLHFVVVSRT